MPHNCSQIRQHETWRVTVVAAGCLLVTVTPLGVAAKFQRSPPIYGDPPVMRSKVASTTRENDPSIRATCGISRSWPSEDQVDAAATQSRWLQRMRPCLY